MTTAYNSNLNEVNHIVAIGGGHGLGRIMSALSFMKERLTGIVTTTDNGGSTGRIRDSQGGIAWGDLRNCLNQIITEPSTASALFEYRFSGDGELADHNLGNLMLKALEDMHIRPLDAVNLIRDLLHVKSFLIPMSESPVHLAATLQSGLTIVGETNVDNLQELPKHLSLVPQVNATQEAIIALQQAEVILFGPGSFLTSIMPPLLLPEVKNTIRHSRAKKVLIDNLGIEFSPAAALSLEERIHWLNRTIGQDNIIDGVRIKTDLNPTQWDYVTTGTQQLDVANIKFFEQHNGKTETAELKNFESKTNLTEKNDFVDLNFNFKLAELIDSSFPIGSFAVDARADHLEAATFSDLIKALSSSDQIQMESAAVKLLQNRPHFVIKPLIWANSAGQSRFNLDIDLADTDITKALRGKVTELFKTFDLSVDVNKAALQAFLTQSAQFHQGLDKIQAEQQASVQMEEIIRESEKDNFAVNRAEAITAELKLTGGKLMLNGKEIPEEQIQMVLFMLMMGGLK